MRGHIYGIVHPQFPGYVKIGKASSVARRLSQYNTGDPYRRYDVAFVITAKNYHRAELIAHRLLNGYRVLGTEWFRIAPEEACALIVNKLEE
jgi:hypothetical protein